MIESPSHHDTEVTVLQIVMSRPAMIADVPDLELQDFDDPICRLVWMAIVNALAGGFLLAPPMMPAVESAPSSHAELRLECASLLRRCPGAQSDNLYGIVADELEGKPSSSWIRMRRRWTDPRVVVELDSTEDEITKRRLKSAASTLSYARRAREAMSALGGRIRRR